MSFNSFTSFIICMSCWIKYSGFFNIYSFITITYSSREHTNSIFLVTIFLKISKVLRIKFVNVYMFVMFS